jgi:hypothetical protein
MPAPSIEMPSPTQLTLELPAPPVTAETPLLPARMINEYVYCPRLAFLEWVDAEWADSGDTEQGRRTHVRVDAGGGRLHSAISLSNSAVAAIRFPQRQRCGLIEAIRRRDNRHQGSGARLEHYAGTGGTAARHHSAAPQ